MAAVTIRNLPDEVVDALKQRAQRNSRSMEAEAREALTRLVAGDYQHSGLEEVLERPYRPRRWTTRGSDVNAWLDAHPPTDDERRVAKGWLAEHNARPYDEEPLRDPWEHAEQRWEDLKKAQGSA